MSQLTSLPGVVSRLKILFGSIYELNNGINWLTQQDSPIGRGFTTILLNTKTLQEF